MSQQLSTEIYKIDSKGKIRTWQFVVEGDSWWTIAGLQDGNKVTSAPTVCTPKSQPTAELQALFEAKAEEANKLKRDYHTTVEGTAMAKYFAPMLAEKYDPSLVHEGDMVQPKLDGIRCIATIDGLATRKGEVISSCPHIIEQLKPVFAKHPKIILDGELYNHEFKDNFNELASIIRKKRPSEAQLKKAPGDWEAQLQRAARDIEFHVYDVVPAGNNLGVPATARNSWLTDYLEPAGLSIIPVPTYVVDNDYEVRELFKSFVAKGYEGAMVRAANAPYRQNRTTELMKFKEFQTRGFPVVRVEEGLGNWAGYAKRVVCTVPDGREFGAGVKGNRGFTKELLSRDVKIATIQFFELTPDGIPRFPVAIDFDRPDA